MLEEKMQKLNSNLIKSASQGLFKLGQNPYKQKIVSKISKIESMYQQGTTKGTQTLQLDQQFPCSLDVEGCSLEEPESNFMDDLEWKHSLYRRNPAQKSVSQFMLPKGSQKQQENNFQDYSECNLLTSMGKSNQSRRQEHISSLTPNCLQKSQQSISRFGAKNSLHTSFFKKPDDSFIKQQKIPLNLIQSQKQTQQSQSQYYWQQQQQQQQISRQVSPSLASYDYPSIEYQSDEMNSRNELQTPSQVIIYPKAVQQKSPWIEKYQTPKFDNFSQIYSPQSNLFPDEFKRQAITYTIAFSESEIIETSLNKDVKASQFAMSNQYIANESSNEDSDKISIASVDRGTKRTLDTKKRISQIKMYRKQRIPTIKDSKGSINVDEQGLKCILEYELRKTIGSGSYGKVKKAWSKVKEKFFAIKIINTKKLERKLLDKNANGLLEKEIAIHKNVVRLYEVIKDSEKNKLYLVMEYHSKGSVMSKRYWHHEFKSSTHRKRLPSSLPEEKLRKYFGEFILGLDYLHNFAHVIHRDIKPDNLLIDADDHLKIADFGVSQIFESSDKFNNSVGTRSFIAPEAISTQSYGGQKADIWACGVTFFYLSTGVLPFKHNNIFKLKEIIQQEKPNFDLIVNPQLRNLIEGCLIKNPKNRFTIDQIMVIFCFTKKKIRFIHDQQKMGQINCLIILMDALLLQIMILITQQ